MTSGVKTEETISLLNGEDKTVYYTLLGMDGIETKCERSLTVENLKMRCILSLKSETI